MSIHSFVRSTGRSPGRNLVLICSLACFLLLAGCPEAEAPSSSGTSGTISADALISSPPEGVLILDVRTPDEFSAGHIEGAVNVPLDQLEARLEDLGAMDQPIVVYCERGGRAAKAESVLASAGFSSVLHLEGDMSGWRAEGRPVVER